MSNGQANSLSAHSPTRGTRADPLCVGYPRGQLGTQQASGGGFVSQATHGCKLVDGVGGQMPRFQVHAIAHHDDAVEGQPRFGAVPGDELVDGVLVDSARSCEPRLLRTAVLQ